MSTIRDVARLAGVSVSTVSRTLSGRAFVEESTRQKVLEAVETLHYQPNMMAKGLREGRSYTLAFLVPDIGSVMYPSLMLAIERAASKRGYLLILCNTDNSIENEKRLVEMLGNQQVAGIFCMSVGDDTRHLAAFQNKYHIPVVLINREGEGQLCSVSMNNEYGGYCMTRLLLEQGHRKIAGMFGSFDKSRFRQRYSGCKKALEEYGIAEYERFFVYDVGDDIDEACRHALKLLLREERPTAFFASIDMMAMGIYSAAYRQGIKIPHALSVAGFDNVATTRHMAPPLTTYSAPVDSIAENAMELLLGWLQGDTTPSQIILNGSVEVRGSVSAPPAPGANG